MTYVIRTVGDPMRLMPAVRAAVAEADRNQPVFNFRTVEQYLEEQIRLPRYYMLLFGIFGAVAIVLAAVGIYGMMAYSVAQRTHEIGIRMALGASTGSVLALVIRQGLVLIATGLALGLAASLALTRLIAGQLWGVTATDPQTFSAISLVLILTGLIACLVPSRRAAKVDPLVALRHE